MVMAASGDPLPGEHRQSGLYEADRVGHALPSVISAIVPTQSSSALDVLGTASNNL
jgi:hypothetical protein